MKIETMTLTDFLLARIAADERFIQRDADPHPADRARVLAECEAKRRIIKGARNEIGPTAAEDWLLPLLALPYADHPDYRPEWRHRIEDV